MLSEAGNILLTRTGPQTPMGDRFRRFGHPVLLSAELSGPDGPPVRVTILGENPRAFRATGGSVGVIRFRRLILDSARSLTRDEPPLALAHPDAYRVRGGRASRQAPGRDHAQPFLK
jgi:hypothetical protein